MVSLDVTSLLASVPTGEASLSLADGINFTSEKICKFSGPLPHQRLFPIPGSFHTKIWVCQGFSSLPYCGQSVHKGHWFRYVYDTWVRIKTNEAEAYGNHITFTCEDTTNNRLLFWTVPSSEDRNFTIEV